MFSLLKLLIYEPYYYALVGWSARPRLEPSQAIGTSRALPRPPSTRLGCHASVVYMYYCSGLTLVLLGTAFPLFMCIYCETPVIILFSCKAYVLLFKLIKEEVWQLWDQANVGSVH